MVKVELRKFNIVDYFRFLLLTLNKDYSRELDNTFFGYIFKGIKSLFLKKKYYKFAILVDDKFAGSIALYYNKDTNYELGFIVLRKYRNKGIATEASKKILDFGFNKLKLKKIIAITDISNKTSQRVLRKLGFKIIKENKKEKEFIWEKRK
ncbi:MAG: GNAT family N-acetyltransferase [Nanoarchaeota archaeon]|nr:GNAT family N-acetyltransferase [Nanoarchaeota archaeon]